MAVHIGSQLLIPKEIESLNLRRDLWSVTADFFFFFFAELTLPQEAAADEAYEREMLKCLDLAAQAVRLESEGVPCGGRLPGICRHLWTELKAGS